MHGLIKYDETAVRGEVFDIKNSCTINDLQKMKEAYLRAWLLKTARAASMMERLLQKGKFTKLRGNSDTVSRMQKWKKKSASFDRITRFSKYGKNRGCVRKYQPINVKIARHHKPAILKKKISGKISKWRKRTKQRKLITTRFWTSEKR